MAKIRDDLQGVVSVDGRNLKAGDTVPADVTVGDHVLAQEEEKPKRQSRKADEEQ